MMIKIETNVKEVTQRIMRFPTMLYMAANRTLSNAAIEITQIMRRPGTNPTYPIQWDSEKQKRAFFATDGFGGGIPSTRTGDHAAGWTVGELSNGYQIQNLGNQAVFLYGTPSGVFEGANSVQSSGQSNIHKGRWRLISQVIDAVVARLPKQILDALRIEINA